MRRFLPALLVLLFLVGPVHGQSPDSILVSQEVLQTLADVASASIDTTDGAAADTTATSGASGSLHPQAVFNVLFFFLALSLVFESAMSVIFDWRLFIRYFEGRGIKTPVIVGTAFLVFSSYNLDIVHDLLEALNQKDQDRSMMGQFLTALLIAGGSGGVFRIFARLGIRSPEARRRKAKEERAGQSPHETDTPDSSA
jgi:hypothetical protein